MNTASTISNKNLNVWTNRTFVKMFSAYSISTFGEWFDAFAIEILVAYRWHVDPIMIALIPIMIALPGILLGSIAGVIADRWKKINLMLLADIAEVVLTIMLLFAPGMYWLLPILALRSAMGVFRVPAQQALTRQVVHEDQLLKATSYNGLVNQFSKIAGPLLGAIALSVISPQMCILMNAITRLLSCVLLFTLRHIDENEALVERKGQEEEEEQKQSFTQLWKQGWVCIAHSRILLSTLLVNMAVMLIILMIDFQLPTLFREIAPHHESLFGWVVAATGVGAVITIMILNRLNRVRYGPGIGGGVALIGVAFGGMGLLGQGSSEVWSITLGLVIGIGNGLFIVTYNYVLQKETPKDMTGRIFGIQNTIGSTIMIIAPLTGGIMIQGLGVGRVFFILGIMVLTVGLLCLLFQRKLWPTKQSVVEYSRDVESVSS